MKGTSKWVLLVSAFPLVLVVAVLYELFLAIYHFTVSVIEDCQEWFKV